MSQNIKKAISTLLFYLNILYPLFFSIVSGIRWYLDMFEELGKNTKTWDILSSALIEMVRSMIKAEESRENLKRYPFRLLFRSEASMDDFLKNGLNYTSKELGLFKNLYLTPFFPLCVYEAVSGISIRNLLFCLFRLSKAKTFSRYFSISRLTVFVTQPN